MIHELKTWPEYWNAINENLKAFEIRKNDRNYQVGDELELQEYDPKEQKYTGRSFIVEVTYITDFMQQPGYVVMSIK